MSDSFETKEVTRRNFITTAAAGYALAVSPVTALAITTATNGLETADVKIPIGKESMPGYAAWPKKKGEFPVVIVVHEIFGVHEYIKDVCRRLANEGYFAVAPSLYFREGDATKIKDIPKLIKDIVSKVPQNQVMADLDHTFEWLDSQKSADAGRVGITGFCWGGGAVWLYAAHNPKLKAGVAWYGRITGEKSDNMPKYPLDIAPSLTVPVLGLYGGKDSGIPVSDVEKMKELLAKGKSGSEIIVFPDAEHGFHADYRPSYNEKAAKEGWRKLLSWFAEHGLKPS